MIPKIIYPDSFDFGMAAASLMEMTSRGPDKGYMHKRAALFDKDKDAFQRKPGYSYIHLITTGASEKYGPNSNSDAFIKEAKLYRAPEPKDKTKATVMLDGGLKKYHNDTFEKMAAVYKHHQNKHKGGKPSGYIVKAAYNDEMERGELIIGVDNKIWEKELQKMAEEKPIFFSIAADVPHDYCSICLSKHKQRSDYCEHLRKYPLAISKEGHQVCAINDIPLFHDISGVVRPADKLAFGLRKIASGIISGAELAELDGMMPDIRTIKYYMGFNNASRRVDTIRKLAEIEKKIVAESCGGPLTDAQLAFEPESGFGEIDDSVIDRLRNEDLPLLLGELKNKKIILPLEVFFKLLVGPEFLSIADEITEAKSVLPGIFGRMLNDTESLASIDSDGSYEPAAAGCRLCDKDIETLTDSGSLEDRPVEIRVIRCIAKRPFGVAKIVKNASVSTVSSAADFLAREYAKYVAAFAEGQSPRVQNLTIAQMWATCNK